VVLGEFETVLVPAVIGPAEHQYRVDVAKRVDLRPDVHR
jgi:hypothetical protein